MSPRAATSLASSCEPTSCAKLFDTIAPWYAERNGGYTRIMRIGRRLGDAGEIALLELVKSPELREKLRKERDEAEKAARTATKGKSAKSAPAKGGAAAAKGEKGEKAETATATAEGEGGKKDRSAKPARGEKFRKKGVPTQHKPTTRARQRGKSGD